MAIETTHRTGGYPPILGGSVVPFKGLLRAAEGLADTLRQQARVLADASWALDSALSARRKQIAGYRDPDPSTGRQREHDGISDAAIHAALNRAEDLCEQLGDGLV